MIKFKQQLITSVITVLLGIFAAVVQTTALAAVIESGGVTFENLDTPPLYFKATVTYDIFAPGDADSPIVSASDYTYVYTLTNELAAPPAGQINIPLDRLNVGVGSSATISAVTSTGTGVVPSSIDTSVVTMVQFLFGGPFVNPGQNSNQLIIQSPNAPGDVTATVGFGGSVDDQLLRGPFELPVADFACYDVNKVKILVKHNKSGHDQIKIQKGAISLNPGDSFNTTTDIVKLSLNNGDYLLSIPAGSFERKGSREDFKYETGSGVTPQVKFRLNIDKGEWAVRINKTDATMLENATNLDIVLMVGDVKGQVNVPLTVVGDNSSKTLLKYKNSSEFSCPKLRDDDSSAMNDSGHGRGHHKRSCLSSFEVTYHMGQPDQEIIDVFTGNIGHPETTVSITSGTSATFHTSCSQMLQCGDTDASGDFTITALTDATGKLTAKFGIDPSCDITPATPGETGWQCLENSDCNSGICDLGQCQ